jgi:hypothetical protein
VAVKTLGRGATPTCTWLRARRLRSTPRFRGPNRWPRISAAAAAAWSFIWPKGIEERSTKIGRSDRHCVEFLDAAFTKGRQILQTQTDFSEEEE